MKHPNGVGPASALTENEALEVCSTAKTNKQASKTFRQNAQAVRAELTESDTACACGITAEGSSPVLKLCRMLIGAGTDPSTPLEAWRDSTLALAIRSIGEASCLEINSAGNDFTRYREVRAGPPVHLNGSRGTA